MRRSMVGPCRECASKATRESVHCAWFHCDACDEGAEKMQRLIRLLTDPSRRGIDWGIWRYANEGERNEDGKMTFEKRPTEWDNIFKTIDALGPEFWRNEISGNETHTATTVRAAKAVMSRLHHVNTL